MSERVVVEVVVQAPVEHVWHALRDRNELVRWFGWDYEGLEAEVEQIFFGPEVRERAPAVLDIGDGTYTLTETAPQLTRVTVTRSTPPSGDPDAVDLGWVTFTQQLRFLVERAPAGPRSAAHIPAPSPLPDGERWFQDAHHVGLVLASGRELLVVEGEMAVHSRFGV